MSTAVNAATGFQNNDSGVRTEIQGPVGSLVLSRASTLNALTLDMVKALQSGLNQLESSPAVKLIVIRSDSDRAFCAGGDMKRIRQYCLDENFDAVSEYFSQEYALNLAIARCSKPYLALIDGVAMGGGLGVSIHGRFRVVTERALLAMPETRIGFFPDVGASYFLPRLSLRSGYWLGLTSQSIKGHQAVMTGLATHHVASNKIEPMMQALQLALQEESESDSDVENVIARYLETFSDLQQVAADDEFTATLQARASWFCDDDPSATRQRLKNADSDDAHHLLALLDLGSPYALETTRTLFAKAQGLELDECLQLEFATAMTACRHPDLIEGVRAVLVDKDRNPCWQ